MYTEALLVKAGAERRAHGRVHVMVKLRRRWAAVVAAAGSRPALPLAMRWWLREPRAERAARCWPEI